MARRRPNWPGLNTSLEMPGAPSICLPRPRATKQDKPKRQPVLPRHDPEPFGPLRAGIASLDDALAQREDLILARQEKGESLWQLSRKEEAVSVWTDALQRNERLVLIGNELAGARRSMGLPDEATSLEKQADQFSPDDPLFHWMIALRLKTSGCPTSPKNISSARSNSTLGSRSNPASLFAFHDVNFR